MGKASLHISKASGDRRELGLRGSPVGAGVQSDMIVLCHMFINNIDSKILILNTIGAFYSLHFLITLGRTKIEGVWLHIQLALFEHCQL